MNLNELKLHIHTIKRKYSFFHKACIEKTHVNFNIISLMIDLQRPKRLGAWSFGDKHIRARGHLGAGLIGQKTKKNKVSTHTGLKTPERQRLRSPLKRFLRLVPHKSSTVSKSMYWTAMSQLANIYGDLRLT